jgi:hypothetical protein
MAGDYLAVRKHRAKKMEEEAKRLVQAVQIAQQKVELQEPLTAEQNDEKKPRKQNRTGRESWKRK